MPRLNHLLQTFLAHPIVLGDPLLPTHYAHFDTLETFQIGMRTHGQTGESLVSETDGAWRPDWYAIAQTGLDDPIFIAIDQADQGYPVYYAPHGAGRWDALEIAPNLETFARLLQALAEAQDAHRFQALIEAETGSANAFWQEIIDARKQPTDMQEEPPLDSTPYDPSDFESGDLIITNLGPQKLRVVQLVSKHLGLPLKEALALADTSPLKAASGVRKRLRPLEKQLDALGARTRFQKTQP
ncbi:hypothetical protein [Pseudomonas sp.]|uniref:hypothetical protein n=1 Tax=Pseudomonas sp. TaxID=306 RepID=UPI0028AF78D2|nr:hypothetical protein [Pseudomonas sp.]